MPNQSPKGVTPTERFLFRLCQSSFLHLWSYANVFRDQGKNGAGDGKELCDVLVVFGDAIILFSDKRSEFPKSGDEQLDWNRWCRRSIIRSQRQLSGAERWIRRFPNRIFEDRRCTQPLQITLPPPERMRIYKVVVALGAAERCQAHFGGGSGSLMLLKQGLTGGQPGGSKETYPRPFTVNLVEANRQLFHIVDDVTLPVLLHELDTIADFVEYLDMKEKLIRDERLISVGGEEDLVGLFLGVRAALPQLVEVVDAGPIIVAEGIYADILQREDYQSYVEENRISYFWDYLIVNHISCVLRGTLVAGSAGTFTENEEILRFLASEPRVRRRMLASAFLDLIQQARQRGDEISSRAVRLSGDTMYVFQVTPRGGRAEPERRAERQEFLHQYCFLTAWRHQDIKRVVGICTEGRDPQTDGYDVLFIETEEWSPEMVAAGAELEREMAADVSRELTKRKLKAEFATGWGEPEQGSTSNDETLK